MDTLIAALLDGDSEGAVQETRRLLDDGVACRQLITEGVEVAMERLDAKCTVKQFNLLEIMLSGRAVTGVMKAIYPPGERPQRHRGVVVLATLEGDIHDLGKNILKVVLEARGVQVEDCGKDCAVETVVERALETGAKVVGVSGLISTVVPKVREVKPALEARGEAGARVKVLAGGAALKQVSAHELRVDHVAQHAFDGAHYVDGVLESWGEEDPHQGGERS